MVKVRYFAGIAELAGTSEESFATTNLGALKNEILCRHGQNMAAPLSVCAFLAEGEYLGEDAALTDGITVDVLPPFAGG
ncbi:MAG: MoaD/ThiS family protein [Actinomycetaceae bacterium]|nr:MoaD/ThiS family protein [Actinomycetaceae bacterium]